MTEKIKRDQKFRKKSSQELKEKLISDKKIAVLAKRLVIALEREKKENLIDKVKKGLESPGVKQVLALLGMGSFLTLSVAVPSLPEMVGPILDAKSDRGWKKFNYWYLMRTLKRLRKQKVVRFKTVGDKTIIELTNKGKKKILKYSLEEMEIKRPKIWDRKWRLIIYDVPNSKRYAAGSFSDMLESLGMYRLQKSVFIYPFPCHDEVRFLREYFNIANNVWLLTVIAFENDEAFRDYFGI